MTLFHLRGLAAAIAVAAAFVPASLSAEPGACSTRHTEAWKAGGAAFTVDAFADGPTCELAVATIVIRGADGVPLWSEAYPASQVMVLAGQPDVSTMQQALFDWTLQDGSKPTSKSLPEWKAGADMPVLGDFPFYLEEGIDRDAYAAIRKADLPMYCYIQGMESMACLVLQDGGLTKVGAQSFPG